MHLLTHLDLQPLVSPRHLRQLRTPLLSTSLIEEMAMNKVETRLTKMATRHLSLAAGITVAKGLILSSLWYLTALWAGDLNFFVQIQRRIEAFVWDGLGVQEWTGTHLVKIQPMGAWVCCQLLISIVLWPGT